MTARHCRWIRWPSLTALFVLALVVSPASGGRAPDAATRRRAGDTDSLRSARAALSRGSVAFQHGNFVGAGAAMDSAVGCMQRQLPDTSLELVRARVALGGAYVEAGRFADATAVLARAMERLDVPAPPDSDGLALALHTEGRLFLLMRNFAKAKTVLERALAIRIARGNDGSVDSRITMNLLANACSGSHDYARSRPVYERLIALERASARPDSVRLAMYVTNLASNVSDQASPDYELARRLYFEALGIKRRQFGPYDPRLATTIINLGSLSEVTGRVDDELVYLREATAIYERSLGPQHPETAELYLDQSKALLLTGHLPEAFELALRGERLTREHIRLTARSLTPGSALQFEQTCFSGLDVAFEVLLRSSGGDAAMRAAAFEEIVRSRSVLLDEFAARNRDVAASDDSAMTALVDARNEAQRRFAEWTMKSLRMAQKDSLYRATLDDARAAAEAAEARLARAAFERGGAAPESRMGVEAVRAGLPPRSALCSFVRYSVNDTSAEYGPAPRYAAFVVRPGTDAPRLVDLGSARVVDSLVTRWQASGGASNAADAEQRYRAAATRLRQRVWDPLAPLLAGATHVFVVPDGSLHLVSFATLPVGAARYLAESGPAFHYLSTERDLAGAPTEPARAPSLLVIGGADYDHDDDAFGPLATAAAGSTPAYRGASPRCESFGRERFAYLAGSREEADEVASQWRQLAHGARRAGAPAPANLRTLAGAAATEAAFKRLAPGYTAVHVATHGFFVDPACATGDEDDPPADRALLLSGLVLAGANQHRTAADREDGFLTAEEIAAMDLRVTRWVALSGCGTGLGAVVDQEGVFGLRRAFQLAGAGTVIMSLWSVRDVDSERWMRLLYEARFGRHRSAPDATTDAMRGALAELRARGEPLLPARWGAFVSCGAWR